ncbi:MAG: O-acetyl-ADP-ribose deacetylase [Acidimicrobiales bacterium]|nr:O-acetyl-ADP-ribose deacetylase [Acidimicrobiales bacterium]
MQLRAVRADITTLGTDAIVNAANDRLTPGGGVCGAIHRAAGPGLADACAAIGHCPPGEARLTPGFALPARWVVHAVGPIWLGGDRNEADLLASCYREAVAVADAAGAATIAFPAISTGIYGYPPEEAAAIAVATLRSVTPVHLREAVLVAFDESTLERYERLLRT